MENQQIPSPAQIPLVASTVGLIPPWRPQRAQGPSGSEVSRSIFSPLVRGSFKQETSAPVTTPLDQEDVAGQFIAHGPGTPQVLQRPSEGPSDAPTPGPVMVWAAKVEWTFLTVALPHSVQLGSSTRRLNTSHSNRVSQSEQWYSKIGIAL